MWIKTIATDFNGLVLFDPSVIWDFYGAMLTEGTDLFARYRTTEEGDTVLSHGIVVPLLAIDDGGYDVTVRLSSEPWEPPGRIVVENGVFPLRVVERLVLADLVVLKEWMPELGWHDVPVPPGNYGTRIRGYVMHDSDGNIGTAGYDFSLEAHAQLPICTGNTAAKMRVLRTKHAQE